MRCAIVLLLFVAACASSRRQTRECAPLPAEYSSYEALYRECAVDEKVRLTSLPSRPDFSRLAPLATSSAGCYTALYHMVVDEKGTPVPRSVRLLRTNSQSYADAISESLNDIRFQPARKNGIPVAQLYEYEAKMQYTVRRSDRPGAPRPPPC